MKAPAPRRKTAAKTVARTPAGAPVSAAQAVTAEAPRRKTSIPQFFNEVRGETRKITWPTWKETWITSVMVAMMVAFASVFFLVVDGALSFSLQQLLKLAS
jgi:preprotein translocase subunit SecE